MCTKVFFRSFHIPEWACLVVRRLTYLINIVGAMIMYAYTYLYMSMHIHTSHPTNTTTEKNMQVNHQNHLTPNSKRKQRLHALPLHA